LALVVIHDLREWTGVPSLALFRLSEVLHEGLSPKGSSDEGYTLSTPLATDARPSTDRSSPLPSSFFLSGTLCRLFGERTKKDRESRKRERGMTETARWATHASRPVSPSLGLFHFNRSRPFAFHPSGKEREGVGLNSSLFLFVLSIRRAGEQCRVGAGVTSRPTANRGRERGRVDRCVRTNATDVAPRSRPGTRSDPRIAAIWLSSRYSSDRIFPLPPAKRTTGLSRQNTAEGNRYSSTTKRPKGRPRQARHALRSNGPATRHCFNPDSRRWCYPPDVSAVPHDCTPTQRVQRGLLHRRK